MRQLVHFKASLVNCLLAVMVLLSACTKEERTSINELSKTNLESGQVANDWIALGVQLTPDMPGYTPPIAARTFAYLGLGIFETVSMGIDGKPTLQGKLNGLSSHSLPILYEGGEVSWSLAVNECMFVLFNSFYRNATPASKQAILDLHSETKNTLLPNYSADIAEKSIMYGAMMGKAIFNYALTDGQDDAFLNNYPANYSSPSGQGLWAPTSNEIKRPLLPYWGDVRCFVPHNDLMEMSTPPAFSTAPSSQFYANALDVHNRVRNLDAETVEMVKYWNDDQDQSLTTAGHMMAVLASILIDEKRDLAFSATAYAKLGICLHDATVSSWRVKYKYNILRPETYIKENIDKDFISLIEPQATPEYSSSSTAVGMASSEVLSELFGYNYAFTDKTHQFRKDIEGTPRSFKSFKQMADEISMSCLYGGIHYRFSLEAGQEQGAFIGNMINNLKF